MKRYAAYRVTSNGCGRTHYTNGRVLTPEELAEWQSGGIEVIALGDFATRDEAYELQLKCESNPELWKSIPRKGAR